ncbi:MAG: dihydrolipoyl dehydrogenase [Alphaproteobacteria bacterium]|nr:dihydrolipoyl dehydrogenase [Alphaproteobacteria bacterium]
MPDYDLLVLGAGPGGYPAAIRAAQLGLSTACVEREHLGGVCLNWGCIPSKALIRSAEVAWLVREAADFGLTASAPGVDMPAVIARSRKVAQRFRKGVGGLFRKHGVTALQGTARLVGPGRVALDGPDGGEVTARHIVIATGARARTFPGIVPDGERILTSREAIVREELPGRAVILGAGAIGCEFAYVWRGLGSEVTVVEAQPEILPLEDSEAAAVVRKGLTAQGVAFRTGVRVERVERRGEGCVVHLAGGDTLEADVVLVALGVSPNSGDLGLEALGAATDARGFVQVDASFRTRVPGLYAVGDVCDHGPALAHLAMRQAHVCVERIAGLAVPDVDLLGIPSVTYCQPQLASLGLTEAAARQQGREVRVGRFPFAANGRAQGMGHPEGFTKVVVDARTEEILGATIVGAEASELVAELVVARSAEATAASLVHAIHPHPSASEAVLEAVAGALGVGVHL